MPLLWRDRRAGSEPVHGRIPDLVSVRPIAMPDESDWRYRFGVSVAFADGVFGRVPMPTPGPPTDEQALLHTSRWERTEIQDGNLHVPGIATVPSDALYRNCYEPPHTGPSVWSRFVEIRLLASHQGVSHPPLPKSLTISLIAYSARMSDTDLVGGVR